MADSLRGRRGEDCLSADAGEMPRDRAAPTLDNVIHQRVRLGIASALASGEALSFTRLKELLALTDGNLSVHLQRLEKAGYVVCEKSRKKPGRAAVSRYRLTRAGLAAFRAYLSQMEAIIDAARKAGPASAGA